MPGSGFEPETSGFLRKFHSYESGAPPAKPPRHKKSGCLFYSRLFGVNCISSVLVGNKHRLSELNLPDWVYVLCRIYYVIVYVVANNIFGKVSICHTTGFLVQERQDRISDFHSLGGIEFSVCDNDHLENHL